MRSPYKILLEPVLTERALTLQAEKNPKYTFRVLPDANKREIRSAIELAFKVKVLGVNTITRGGKKGRFGYGHAGQRSAQKQAIITIAEGQRIEFV